MSLVLDAKVTNATRILLDAATNELESRFNARLDHVKSDFKRQLDKKDQRIDQIKGQIVQKDRKIEALQSTVDAQARKIIQLESMTAENQQSTQTNSVKVSQMITSFFQLKTEFNNQIDEMGVEMDQKLVDQFKVWRIKQLEKRGL